jgi:hypothetical protein
MKKLTCIRIVYIMFCLSMLLLVACGDGGGGSLEAEGMLKVTLTDDPASFEGVYITIVQVLVHQSADAGEEEIAESSHEAGWREVALSESISMPINLLELQDVKTLLAEDALPAGHYQQIRLVLEENTDTELFNYVILKEELVETAQQENGDEHIPLETPSAQQSGLKLINQFTILEGMTTELLIDFDAEESVIETGNGKFQLKPVLKMEAVIIEDTSDTDGDGVPDDEDNCPETSNPDQEDLDEDGVGAACDADDEDPGV